MVVAVQDAAAGQQSTEQNRNQNAPKRIVAGQKGNQDPAVTIPGVQRFVGPPMDGRDLDHAGKAWTGASQETSDQGNSADMNTRYLGGSHITADGANLESQRGLADQEPSQETSDQPEDQAPVDRRVAEWLEHLLIRNRVTSRFVQTARIAHPGVDRLVQNRDR